MLIVGTSIVFIEVTAEFADVSSDSISTVKVEECIILRPHYLFYFKAGTIRWEFVMMVILTDWVDFCVSAILPFIVVMFIIAVVSTDIVVVINLEADIVVDFTAKTATNSVTRFVTNFIVSIAAKSSVGWQNVTAKHSVGWQNVTTKHSTAGLPSVTAAAGWQNVTAIHSTTDLLSVTAIYAAAAGLHMVTTIHTTTDQQSVITIHSTGFCMAIIAVKLLAKQFISWIIFITSSFSTLSAADLSAMVQA